MFLPVGLPGQTPTAPTTAKPTDAPAQVPTIQAAAQLVVVDVVVTDKSGRPVHGLKAADFSLSEGSTPQTIRHFEEHSAQTVADAANVPLMPKMPPGVYTNYTPAPAAGAVNLLLLDALNTPMKDQAYVRQQLLDYLKTVAPGTRIAIFGLTSRLTVLQGFTSDPEVLKAVMTKGLAKASVLLDDQVGGGGIQNSTADDLEDAGTDATTVANVRQFEATEQSFQLQLRAKYTLDAMNDIARYLAGIPGRKNLIWFSGSFPIDVLPDTSGTLGDPFAAMASSEDEFRDTVALLAKSQVAVYPIDARGLMTSPVFDAATNRNYGGARGAARMSQDQTKFFTDQTQEHGTMQDMAAATGGKAFVNTNGLTKAVATAIDEGSNYYTLTYTPSDYVRDGKLHKIKVEVARPNVTLAYRHGYYADAPATAGKPVHPAVSDAALTQGTATAQDSVHDAMHLAMTRGAPTPTEILMKVAVFPTLAAGETEDKVAPGNTLSAKAKGPFRSYNLAYAVNPSDVAFFKTGDGKAHADLEFIAFVFDPDGAVVNLQGQSIRITGTPEEIRKAVEHGVQFNQRVSVPVKGQYFFRIAVHDLNRDHFGAVEFAVAEVKNLAPPAAPGK